MYSCLLFGSLCQDLIPRRDFIWIFQLFYINFTDILKITSDRMSVSLGSWTGMIHCLFEERESNWADGSWVFHQKVIHVEEEDSVFKTSIVNLDFAVCVEESSSFIELFISVFIFCKQWDEYIVGDDTIFMKIEFHQGVQIWVDPIHERFREVMIDYIASKITGLRSSVKVKFFTVFFNELASRIDHAQLIHLRRSILDFLKTELMSEDISRFWIFFSIGASKNSDIVIRSVEDFVIGDVAMNILVINSIKLLHHITLLLFDQSHQLHFFLSLIFVFGLFIKAF